MSEEQEHTSATAAKDAESDLAPPHKGIARRLVVPSALFLVFLGLALFSKEMLSEFGEEAVSQGRKVASYTVQIGIWLTSACLLYTSPSPRDKRQSRMPSSA